MAIECPRCGWQYDVTLFAFGRTVRCACGAVVDAREPHVRRLAQDEPRGGPVMAEERIGRVTHYFGHLQVAVVAIEAGTLAVGDTIRVKGHTSDFTQTVKSMQIEHATVQTASVGQAVGLKVIEHARDQDEVFKVVPE
jgi:translation elongation factor EF-1alpha